LETGSHNGAGAGEGEHVVSRRHRLGVQDALWLEMDKPGNLMVVDSVFWTAEPLDWERYRDAMKERLWDRFPAFRSVVVRGEDGSWWWEEKPDADLEDRFERVVLAEPGGDHELQELIASQRTVPLDRTEPLWRGVFVDGFHGGSAVLLRSHHAIADGIRMVQLTFSIFDTAPDGKASRRRTSRRREPEVPTPAPVDPAPGQPRATLTSQALSQATTVASTSVRLARSTVTNPLGAAHSALTISESLLASASSRVRSTLGARGSTAFPGVLSGVPGDVDTVRKLALGTRNDNTSWTGKVGPHKAIAWSPSIPLEDVKATAQANDATVNDVLVTCVAESLRTYLEQHQAVCHSVTWDVPVNLKPFDPELPMMLGNSFALVQLELPTNNDDPMRTLDVVRRRMGRIKRGHEAVLDFGIQAAISRMNKRLYRTTIDLLANRAVGVLTNVPGPQVPLYVAGQKIEGMMGWAPTTADQVMSFTIYSYDGKVFVGIAADAGLVPDHEQIVDGFADAFRRLHLLTETRGG
jgi:diacylglycerol O-acyltransferase / wax synthase